MNKNLIVAGFIILFAGGLLYTLLPYSSFPCAWWSESPIGTIVMFIGFTLVVVGLFYKPEAEKITIKKRIFLTVISCLGMLLVAVGATVRPLYFLAWVGGPLTLGSMYLYYKELERDGKKHVLF